LPGFGGYSDPVDREGRQRGPGRVTEKAASHPAARRVHDHVNPQRADPLQPLPRRPGQYRHHRRTTPQTRRGLDPAVARLRAMRRPRRIEMGGNPGDLPGLPTKVVRPVSMDRASAAVLLRCLRAKGEAQGQTDEDASLPSLQSRISISPARCTFLLQRLPAVEVPSREGCPLASQAAVVEACIRSSSGTLHGRAPRKYNVCFSPASALQKSGVKRTANPTPHVCRPRRYQARAIRRSSISQPSRI